LLFYFAFGLFPVSFDAIPVHVPFLSLNSDFLQGIPGHATPANTAGNIPAWNVCDVRIRY